MREFLSKWGRFALCARGAAATEYAVTLALLVVATMAGVSTLHTTTRGLWLNNEAQLSRGLTCTGKSTTAGGRQAGSAAAIENDGANAVVKD
jgi:Flp pilus assembly pilin Flp